MTARFYSSALFIAILYSVLATFQNSIFAQIGYQMYTLESFPKWFLVLGGVYFLLAFVLLTYYKMNKYNAIPSLPAADSVTFDAIEEFEREFPIDVARRYIIGESLGGYGTWHFISARPDLFAAAIPICGEGDPTLAKKVTKVNVWAFHGEKDRSVPVSGSRDMIEAMREAGGDPRYSEFEGAGHLIKDQISHTPGVFEWLFAQRKSVISNQ